MAVTSAWAEGSRLAVTRLTPSNTWPSEETMRAPNGPPSLRTFSVARSTARARYSAGVGVPSVDDGAVDGLIPIVSMWEWFLASDADATSLRRVSCAVLVDPLASGYLRARVFAGRRAL